MESTERVNIGAKAWVEVKGLKQGTEEITPLMCLQPFLVEGVIFTLVAEGKTTLGGVSVLQNGRVVMVEVAEGENKIHAIHEVDPDVSDLVMEFLRERCFDPEAQEGQSVGVIFGMTEKGSGYPDEHPLCAYRGCNDPATTHVRTTDPELGEIEFDVCDPHYEVLLKMGEEDEHPSGEENE